ncbi:hypothetical protein DFH08DRAFT_827306 [Mycena albidolilacea]|uniref:Uncharacterized protein n=1 Tax=Mycena albidolilacea TaxID=1033008 RepID=A0AAD6YYM1_9AGAR|nr:hypothetical protein DFH08DRAFT_827306 [Mycena albidolilacea]
MVFGGIQRGQTCLPPLIVHDCTRMQDQPGWETMWLCIRLDDRIPFLMSSTHPCPDQYYDYWNFSLATRVISPTPTSTHRKCSPSPSIQRARKHIKVKHEVSDDEIEVSTVRKVVKLELCTPPAYHYLPPAISPPFASLGASTSHLLTALPVASSLHLRVSTPFSSCLASSSTFPSPPSLLYSMASSTVSSSSFASPGSLSMFSISFVDKD